MRRTVKRTIAWDRLEAGELTFAQSIGMLAKRQYKLQAVNFLKLRRSLIYDLIQGSWKVGHSFTKSIKVTFMRSLSVSRIERRCYDYSLRSPFTERWAPGTSQRCVGDLGEVGQVALVHRSRSRLCAFELNGETVQKTVQAMLGVSQTTFVLVEHLRSWSRCEDLRNQCSNKIKFDDLAECISYQPARRTNKWPRWLQWSRRTQFGWNSCGVMKFKRNNFNHWCFLLWEQSVTLYYIPVDMHLSLEWSWIWMTVSARW